MNPKNLKIALVCCLFLLFYSCKKDNQENQSNDNSNNDPNSISVALKTIPSGASIYINGSQTDKITPFTFTNLQSGNYEYKLKMIDYQDIVHSYYLSIGDHKVVSDTLTPSWSTSFSSSPADGFYTWYNSTQTIPYVVYDPFGNSTFTIPINLTAKIIIEYEFVTNSEYPNYPNNCFYFDLIYKNINFLSYRFIPQNTNNQRKTETIIIDKSKVPSGTNGKITIRYQTSYISNGATRQEVRLGTITFLRIKLVAN